MVSDMLELMRPVVRFFRVMIYYTLFSSHRTFHPSLYSPMTVLPHFLPSPSCYLDDRCCFVPAGQGRTDQKDLSHRVISSLWCDVRADRREKSRVIGSSRTAKILHRFWERVRIILSKMSNILNFNWLKGVEDITWVGTFRLCFSKGYIPPSGASATHALYIQ